MGAPGVRRLLVRVCVAAYRAALKRYPEAFRRRYGDRMTEDARLLVEDAVRRAGLRGWVGVCFRLGRDLLRPLPPKLEAESAGAPPARPSPRGGRRRAGRGRWRTTRHLLDDLAGAWRSLRRRPGFTLLLVGVLGVGVALDVAVFAVVDAYLLRPLPYPFPGRLVQVRPATAAVGWTNSVDVFEKAVSWQPQGFTLVGDAGPDVVLGARVSPDFFDLYGVRPEIGRGFREEEGGIGAAPVAVISHGLWTRRFGADPAIVGRTVRAYGSDAEGTLESFTVVGVLPRDFWSMNGYADFVTSLPAPGAVHVGRLRTDVPPRRAREILTERARAAGELSGEEVVELRPLQDAYTASVRPRLLALQAAALLVLLTACANAGLLILLRASGRGREMGVRRALGAGTARLAAHLFGEGAILAVAAGLVGVALGRGALWVLGGVVEARIGRSVPGGPAALHLDGTVLGAAAALTALMTVAFGAVPLWTAARRSPARRMGAGGRGGGEPGGPHRARRALVAAEIALSLTLLSGGALMVRSALHLRGQELGFSPGGLEAYTVGLTSRGAGRPQRRIDFFRALEEGATELPGVESAALARSAPLTGQLTARRIEEDAGGPPGAPLPEAVPQIVSTGFFDVLGAPVVRGRGFTGEDGPGTTPVALVSSSLASSLRPEGDAVGARIRFTAFTMPEMAEEPGPWLTVVGVAPDLADGVAGPRPTVYVPYLQAPTAWMDVVLRRRPGARAPGQAMKALVRDLDPDTPIYGTADLPEAVRRARAPSRFFAALLGGFSLFALALAVVGLYGVSAYAAHQRRRDLAVRLALGAGRATVELRFLRESAPTLLTGMAAGLAGGRLLGTALRSQLHGVRADDAVTALSVAALVALTALASLWLPARRAARSDISAVLREE